MSKSFFNLVTGAARMVQSNRGQSVRYVTPEGEVAIVATCSPKDYEAVGSDGLVLTLHCHDWLIVSSDLVLAGRRIEPKPGHKVIETGEDGTVTTHEVQMIPGRNCYDSGVGDLSFRVHTKLISTEA